jgi:DNA invertase Pin-like site-specific DNA recombinase
MAQFGGPKLVKALHFDGKAKEQLIKGINKIATALKCTKRTVYRHMSEELKQEKQLLNKEYEKDNN